MLRIYGLVLIAGMLAGCAGSQYFPLKKNNQPDYQTENLTRKILQVDYVILGENHDNPEHHRLQLEVLKALHAQGWLKQLSLEMLKMSQQVAADNAVRQRVSDPAALKIMLGWEKGWDWNLYGPIVSWAVTEGIPLKAANLDRGEMVRIRKQPARLGEQLLGDEGLNIHRERFKSAHCGYVDAERQETMLRVQIARDIRMASSLTAVPEGAALLAGNWHARKDIGVPRFIHSLRPNSKILTVGFIEEAKAGRGSSDKYDVVWATEGRDRPDYCAMMKKRMSTPNNK